MSVLKGSAGLLLKVILQPDYGLWFLWVLYFVCVIHHKIYRSIEDGKYRLIAIIMIYILLRAISSLTGSVFGTHLIAGHVIYYSIGYAVCDALEKTRNVNSGQLTRLIVVFGILYLLLIIPYKWNAPVIVIQGMPNILNAQIDTLYKIVLSASACLFFLLVFKMFGNRTTNSIITMLGRETLGIYVIHFFAISYLRDLPYEGNLGFAAAVCIALIIISLIVIVVVKKNKFASFLLFGSKYY